MSFGFIGAGNMGSALAKGVCASSKDVVLFDIDAEKAKNVAAALGCKAGTREDALNCDYVFLGVKPQQIDELLAGITLDEKHRVFISMAAGVKIEKIKKYLDAPVIRIMPNTPVFLGAGMILYSPGEDVTEDEEYEFVSAMQACGLVQKMDEELIDAGCALSGCGPAYMYMFALGLAKGAQKCGIDEKSAMKLSAQTMLGAAKMLLEGTTDAETLIKNVCSPGGSTIEGVKVLEESKLYEICEKTVDAAYKKNKILGK